VLFWMRAFFSVLGINSTSCREQSAYLHRKRTVVTFARALTVIFWQILQLKSGAFINKKERAKDHVVNDARRGNVATQSAATDVTASDACIDRSEL